MKTVLKILTALAAVVGIAYVIATYGDKIVAWCKDLLAGCPYYDDEEAIDEGEFADEEAEVAVAEEEPVEEVIIEEPVIEISENEPVAEENDFEG